MLTKLGSSIYKHEQIKWKVLGLWGHEDHFSLDIQTGRGIPEMQSHSCRFSFILSNVLFLQENNNSIQNSGNNPSSQPNRQQLSPDHEGRIPSPPHQPRPFIQAPPPPKRGHSPRRPSPSIPTHPYMGMVQSAPQTQLNEESLDGPDHCAHEGGSAPLERDIVISPVVRSKCISSYQLIIFTVLFKSNSRHSKNYGNYWKLIEM